ncbi:MAG TPA: hypothetical protein VFU07_07050 [Candidatus Lumbricidophila sp.]|nr:hypothetical protein [Candidatus Lumbricidophila sp.]
MANLDTLRRLAEQLEQLHAERDRLIRELATAGEQKTAIAAAANLSRMQVHRIADSGPTRD